MNRYPKGQPASLVDVLDRILDKGLVIEPCQRVRLRGIGVLDKKRRLAATSIQTFLRYESVAKSKHLRSGCLTGEPRSQHRAANFFDLLDRILDKGITIGSQERIQVLGIDVLQTRNRIITASIQTYREPMNRRRLALVHHAGS